jgi:ring-1,2-phenylacetyl-CoA epoxidase subunit PaaE
MVSPDQTVPASPLSVSRIPDPQEPVPTLAGPTFALLVVGIALWTGSTVLWLERQWWWGFTIVLNAVASYLLFTVAHDAAHHATSANSRANQWIGRLATPLFAPHASFRTWRFIHMQHHRFTNHDDGRDPDRYTMAGPGWQRPLRWLTVDLQYMLFYIPKLSARPRGEQAEQLVSLGLFVAVIVASVLTGHLVDLLVVLLIPCRLAVLFLGWAFDYLPHHHLHATPTENRFRATRNRVGRERALSPVLLYQNYHLVHHLHPTVPFYRYLVVWRRGEEAYLEHDPALSTVRGRALTADEYREIRGLVEHHD